MAVCPKCSYALVLLPERRRYKCAKCSRLYLQRVINNREFRRQNQKQREITKEEVEREFEGIWNDYRARKKLTEEEKKQRLKKHQKKYYQKHREKILEKKKIYARNNREKTREYEKRYQQKNLIKVREKWRRWYNKNKEREKKRQALRKALAPQATKNNDYSPCKGKSRSQMAEIYFFNYFYTTSMCSTSCR